MNPNSDATRQCWKEGFKFFDIASIMVEDDGEPHTINLDMKRPRREKGTSDKQQQTMVDLSRWEEISRQAVGWFWCARLGN